MQNNEVVKKWIEINYNYVPRYCQTCKIQGTMKINDMLYIQNYIHTRSNQVRWKEKEEENPNDKGKEKLARVEDKNKGEGFVETKRNVWGE